MKRILLNFSVSFLLILCFSKSFSQQKKYNSDTLIVSDFILEKPLTSLSKSVIKVKFSVRAVKPQPEYLNFPYYLTIKLLNGEKKEIYVFKSEEAVYAKPDFFNKSICENISRNFDIPYSEIEENAGKHNLKLIVSAESNYADLGEIFITDIFVEIPQIFEYDEQEFYVLNKSVKPDNEYNKLKGITTELGFSLKFQDFNISGVSKNYDLAEYYFRVKIYDKLTGEEIMFFGENANLFKIYTSEKNQKVLLHIPYNKINLSEGKHDILIKIFPEDTYKMPVYEQLAEFELSFVMPELFVCNFELKSLEARYKIYDVSSVFGRIFSKQTSDAGKGWPDIYWVIKTGDYSEYWSEVNKNSFTVFPGKANFYVTDFDPVFLKIYDHDYTSVDDLAGSYEIKNLKGAFNSEKNNFNFTGISSCSYKFIKNKLPKVSDKIIFTNKIKFKNVSGIQVSANIFTENMPENEQIVFKPIIKNENISVTDFYYENISDSLNAGAPNSNSPEFSVFIPHFFIPQNSVLGFDIFTENVNIPLGKFFATDTFRITQADDAEIYFEYFKSEQNKVSGTQIRFKTVFSEMYNKVYGELFAEYIAKSAENIILDTISANFSEQSFFIPDYKLVDNKIYIYETVFFKSEQRITGKLEEQISVNKPEIISGKVKSVFIKFREIPEFEKISGEIMFDGKIICKGETKNIGKTSLLNFDLSEIKSSANDEFILKLNGFDKNDFSEEIFNAYIKTTKLLEPKIKIKSKNSVKYLELINN